MLLTFSIVHAQKPYKVYCELTASVTTNEIKINKIKINFSQQISGKDYKQGSYLTDEKGNLIKFRIMADCLNFMSKRGWNFVQAFTAEDIYHYIMVKEVTNDDQIFDGVFLKE